MRWKSWREVRKSHKRREMIGTRWDWEVKCGDRGRERVRVRGRVRV